MISRKHSWNSRNCTLKKLFTETNWSNLHAFYTPTHFHKKLIPFLVFGGVPLVFGGVAIISMNVFRPMCRNCNTFIENQYNGFGGVPLVIGGVPLVFGCVPLVFGVVAIISMNVFQPMCCTNTAPVPAAI